MWLLFRRLQGLSSPSYWEANEQKYPNLVSLAMSSVAYERLFKVGKQITKERLILKPENAEKLLFLKLLFLKYLRMVGFKYYMLCLQYFLIVVM